MNAIGRKWLAKELYEVCPICDGIGRIDPSTFTGRLREPGDDGLMECLGCEGYRLIPIGLTVGQIEKMKAEIDRLKIALAAREALGA